MKKILMCFLSMSGYLCGMSQAEIKLKVHYDKESLQEAKLKANNRLYDVVKGNNVEAVKKLFDEDICPYVDIDIFMGVSALTFSVQKGWKDMVRQLLNCGAKINKQIPFEFFVDNGAGKTPLIHAIEGGHTEIAQLLVYRGADVNLSDGKGKSPLIHAILKNNGELVHLLLEHEADPRAQDGNGLSVLYYASQQSSELENIISAHLIKENQEKYASALQACIDSTNAKAGGYKSDSESSESDEYPLDTK